MKCHRLERAAVAPLPSISPVSALINSTSSPSIAEGPDELVIRRQALAVCEKLIAAIGRSYRRVAMVRPDWRSEIRNCPVDSFASCVKSRRAAGDQLCPAAR